MYTELIPLYDFLSRNQIQFHTSEDDLFHTLKADHLRWNELEHLWRERDGAEGPLNPGYFLHFSLADRAEPDAPLHFPVHDFARYMADELVRDRVIPAHPEDIFRIRELAHGIGVRFKRRISR